MKTAAIVILGLAVVVLLVFRIKDDDRHTIQAYKLEKERALERLKHLEDSIVKVDKEFAEADLRAIKMMQEADLRARDAVAEAKKYKDKYEKIAFRSTRSDHERDSLIRAALQH